MKRIENAQETAYQTKPWTCVKINFNSVVERMKTQRIVKNHCKMHAVEILKENFSLSAGHEIGG